MEIAIIFIACASCIALFIALGVSSKKEKEKETKMSPEELNTYRKKKMENTINLLYGNVSPEMICPHCQIKGHVHTQIIEKKTGISGSKATGAILTGGVSLLVTGLSKKEKITEAYCDNCKQTWYF